MRKANHKSIGELSRQYGIPPNIIKWRISHGWPEHLLGEKTIPYSTDRPVQLKRGTLTLKGVK